MRPPSTRELLDAWDRGSSQEPIRRAIALLEAACPQEGEEALARLTIGARDDRLMALRAWVFGRHVVALASCPECAEQLEIDFDLESLRAELTAPLGDHIQLTHEGYELAFRQPQSCDLFAVADRPPEAARRQIVETCVLEARLAGSNTTVDQLPESVIAAVEQRMAECDPRANVQLGVSCAHCGHEWRETFDIVEFLWSELDAWARHLLGEVHLLASAYGWNESEILALSPGRRRRYLELAGL